MIVIAQTRKRKHAGRVARPSRSGRPGRVRDKKPRHAGTFAHRRAPHCSGRPVPGVAGGAAVLLVPRRFIVKEAEATHLGKSSFNAFRPRMGSQHRL
jgi:hypothetical protein